MISLTDEILAVPEAKVLEVDEGRKRCDVTLQSKSKEGLQEGDQV